MTLFLETDEMLIRDTSLCISPNKPLCVPKVESTCSLRQGVRLPLRCNNDLRLASDYLYDRHDRASERSLNATPEITAKNVSVTESVRREDRLVIHLERSMAALVWRSCRLRQAISHTETTTVRDSHSRSVSWGTFRSVEYQ